ncbi:MAG: thymidine kinase [Lachnospiraceae bacterium]|nr:thymidine kinase [Lachnospiraceae bacterium]
MAKLYFKYGAMGSSKTAQALITKFNYEERGMTVLLMKPAIDNREEKSVLRSRIGLEAPCLMVPADMDLYKLYEENYADRDVIIVDECQFLTEDQVDQLGNLVLDKDIPVLCFGLRTDFLTHLFPGSKRLLEIAESIAEIKSICRCGAKATVNARFDDYGNIVYEGEQILIGGNSRYEAMCRRCWLKRKKEQEEKQKKETDS